MRAVVELGDVRVGALVVGLTHELPLRLVRGRVGVGVGVRVRVGVGVRVRVGVGVRVGLGLGVRVGVG